MYRYNSTTSTLGSGDADVRRETEAGTEYLVAPGVIAKEGVLSYDHGDELLPGEELESLTDTATAPIILDHTVDQMGQFVSVDSPAAVNREVVGEFRNPELITGDGTRANAAHNQGDDPLKVRGEYWLRLDKRDVDPGYADALETLKAGGEWPTSPGYDPDIEAESGRYNGDTYDAVQRRPTLDHIGLIVTSGATARVTPDQGVAAGRANAAFTADQTHAMRTDPPADDPDGVIRSRLDAFAHALTGTPLTANADVPGDGDGDGDEPSDPDDDTDNGDDPDEDDETPDDPDGTDTESAADEDDPDTEAPPETDPDPDDTDTTPDSMDDDPRIQTLLDAGLTEDALEDASDSLLDELVAMHDDPEESTDADTETVDADDTPAADADTAADTDDAPEGDGDDGDESEYLTRDEAEQLLAEAQEQPAHEELDRQITANADVSESALEAMDLDDKRALAQSLETDDAGFTATPSTPTPGDAHRANMAGVPGQVSRDDDSLDDDIPAAGYNRRSEGDD